MKPTLNLKSQILTLLLLSIGLSSLGQNTRYGTGTGQDRHSSYFGYYAGNKYTSSGTYKNSFFGHYSGRNASGGFNTFMGYYSGYNNSGSSNTSLGMYSGYRATGSNNTFVGTYSGYNNTSGSYNTFVGGSNGGSSGTGSYNSFFGNSSGAGNTSGSRNTFLGYQAGRVNSSGAGNVFVGYQSGYYENSSNKLYIDNSNTSSPLIWGDFSANKLKVNGTLEATGNATIPSVDASYYDVNSGNGNGLRFWNSNNYKIHMGSSSEYKYGPVTDYSIKMNMNNQSNRGWTWGITGSTPVAAINTQGKMQIKSNFTTEGNIYGKSINAQYSNLYRFGGIYFTWDSDSYGTNKHHSIRSTYGDSYGDHLTMNSFGHIRFNFDSNNNGTNYFQIGHATTGTGNVLFHLDESGKLGIGTSTPDAELSVVGKVRGSYDPQETEYVEMTHGGGNGYINTVGDGDLDFRHDGSTKMSIKPNGNVGIGINPTEKLEIDGSIKGNISGGALRIKSDHGYTDVGPQNTNWSHFETDRPRFYFNKGITVDEGLIGSYNEDLQLQTSGSTAITISNANQDVSITNNLSIAGTMNFNKSTIIEDNTQDDLLVMRGDGTLASRSVQSIESPWLFAEILVGTDTMLAICPDSEVIGQVFVDVIDLNGNLRFGDNAYIDDDLDYGDDGDNDDIPDDWMKFSDRIEFKSSADEYGIVLFDKTDYLQFLNLYHDNGISYLSSSNTASNYFLRADGRNVEFGGDVTIPSLVTPSFSGNESLTFSMDVDNDSDDQTTPESITFGKNGDLGSANFRELFRIEETGNLFTADLELNNTLERVVVRDDVTGRLYSRESGSIGPWTILPSSNLRYNPGSIGIGISNDEPTETIDIGEGTIRIRSLLETETASDFIMASNDGSFHKRDIGSFQFSPFDDFGTYISYGGSVILDDETIINTPTAKLDVDGDLRVRMVERDFANELTDIMMIDADGFLKRRGVDALELSPWVRNGNNLSFTEGKIGIGATNNTADQQTRIVTNLKTGLNVVTNYSPGSTGPSSGYGILATIDNDNVRAFAVKDVSVAGTTAQRDVFRVWGSGKVEAKEVLVAPDIWYDDVFRKDYSLRTLDEVEEFVKEKNHLPEVPSEKEVLENGINLGEMEGVLLKKIEELTLYIIEQNKQLKEQNERIEALENKLNKE